MIIPYSSKIETQMLELYSRLPEKNRRLYAGVEALKLPHGGVSYIARLFDCSRSTVLRGMSELEKDDTLDKNRNRHPGGGRRSELDKHKEIDEAFIIILKEHTAGDPMDDKVKWTDLTRAEISSLLKVKGFNISRNIVKKLLKKHGYVKRKAVKKKR